MGRPEIPSLNWLTELSIIDRFFASDGGVVHIRTSKESPSSVFAKILRDKMENGSWDKPWITVQIDGNNSLTRYFEDMVSQIERTLRMERCPNPSQNIDVSVGEDIKAEGNVNIKNIDITVNNNYSKELSKRAKRIIDTISGDSVEKRFCILFFDSDAVNKKDLNAFRSMLWEGGLKKLTESGMLLIAFLDEDVGMPSWLPQADKTILLLPHYDSESELKAIRELASFFYSYYRFKTPEESFAFAEGVVKPCCRKVSKIYASIAGALARMETRE